jgi:hypothetical protein
MGKGYGMIQFILGMGAGFILAVLLVWFAIGE